MIFIHDSLGAPHNIPLRFALPLYSSNLVVLVAAKQISSSTSSSSKRSSIPTNSNSSSRYASLFGPNKAVIWDDEKQKPVSQLDFNEDIVGVAARLDRLVIVLCSRVVVFGLGQGSVGVFREGCYQTCDNPRGRNIIHISFMMASQNNYSFLSLYTL